MIGQYVLQDRLPRGRDLAAHVIKLAVNVSPLQFRGGNLLDHRPAGAGACRASTPSRLELEITEAVLMDKSADVAGDRLQSCASSGVGISMDDFGTGYSSLRYLLNYPFTKIKIDKSFVMGLSESRNSRVVIARSSASARASA